MDKKKSNAPIDSRPRTIRLCYVLIAREDLRDSPNAKNAGYKYVDNVVSILIKNQLTRVQYKHS